MNKKIIIIGAIIAVIVIIILCFVFIGPKQNKELPISASLKETITGLLAEKYSTMPEEIDVAISTDQENYIRGTFKTEFDKNDKTFLAANIDSKWELAYWGDGEIVCDIVNQYGFPKDMVDDCLQIKVMETFLGQNFIITLMGNQSSGYEWNANYDSEIVQFVTREYIQMDKELMGGVGLEKFTFQALKEGNTDIEFVFKKPAETDDKAIEKLYYQIKVEPNQ